MIHAEYEIIEFLSCKYNIKSLCVCMKASKSGYYKWINRKGKLNCYEQDRALLHNLIIDARKGHTAWGYRQTAYVIREATGLLCSDNLVHKICKENNIKSKTRKTWIKPDRHEHITYQNIVCNDWSTTRPLEKVTTDTTMFYNNGIAYDLTFYLDVFNKEIIVYDLCLSKHGADKKSHINALKKMLKVIKKRGYKNLGTILHSDQGVIYTSRTYNNVHRDYNITRSMSRRGTPTDNPVIESMNGWIKEELRADFNLYKSENIFETISKYINYYNNERKFQSLKYKSPVQYRTELGYD